jgi:hypothetical protein
MAVDRVFCQQASKRGYKMFFEPRAIVRHVNRASFFGFMRHARDWASGANKIEGSVHSIPKKYARGIFKFCYLILYFTMNLLELLRLQVLSKNWQCMFLLFFILLNRIYYGYSVMKPENRAAKKP